MKPKNSMDKDYLFKIFLGVCISVMIGLETWTLQEIIAQGKTQESQGTAIIYINKNAEIEHQKNNDQDQKIVELRDDFIRPEDIKIKSKNSD